MFKVSKWDVILLKKIGIYGLIVSVLLILVEYTAPPSPYPFHNVVFKGAPVLLFAMCLVAWRVSTIRNYWYIFTLTSAVILFGMGTYFSTHTNEYYHLPLIQLLGQAKQFDHTFNLGLIVLALVSVYFSHVWIAIVWLFVVFFFPFKTVFEIVSRPDTFFTMDWQLLLTDGNSMSTMLVADTILNVSIFILMVIGSVVFNKNVLKSTVQAELNNSNLGRYFSPDIKREIEKQGSSPVESEPQDVEVAVLFTDLVSFTQISEAMEPKAVLKLLSDYQTIMVEAIFEHKGTVDKFIGDAVMANFGTPVSHGNDAQNAFDCALSMNKKLSAWNDDRLNNDLPAIQHRIGIHFGHCVVGNMGSKQRTEFAVIGDAVNVASRICDACKKFDTNFLISETVASRIDINIKSEEVVGFKIRGRSEPINLIKIY